MPITKKRSAIIAGLFLIVLSVAIVAMVGTSWYFDHRANRSIARLEEAKDVSGLLKLHQDYMRGDRSSSPLVHIVRALGHLSDNRAVAPLIETLEDQTTPPAARAAAAEALGKLRGSDSLSALVRSLGDRNEQVSKSVQAAMMNFGSDAVEPLVDRLRDWGSSPAAARILAKYGWTPVTDEDRVHLWLGLRDAGVVEKNRDLVLRVVHGNLPDPRTFFAGWESQSKEAQELALQQLRATALGEYELCALVSLGRVEDLPLLIVAIGSRGTKSLAEAYINSGNRELVNVAQDWAKEHGYKIKTRPGPASVSWGILR